MTDVPPAKRTDRQVYRVGEIPADLVEAIRTAEPPPEAAAFDLETPEGLLAALEASEPAPETEAVERQLAQTAIDEVNETEAHRRAEVEALIGRIAEIDKSLGLDD